MYNYNWKQVIQKIQERENSDYSLWEYVTALRGPDNLSYPLKILFNTIVRGKSMPSSGFGVEELESFLSLNSDEMIMEAVDVKKLKNVEHWFTHILYGIKVLVDFGFVENELLKIVKEMWYKNWKDGLKKLLKFYRKKFNVFI